MSAERPASAGPQSLWTFEFAALWLAALVCFSNMSIFYGFYNYLEGLGIPPAARGPLLALEPLTALLLRPYLSGVLHLRNSVRGMLLGVAIITAALLCYPFALTAAQLAVVRVAHGLGYVLWLSAIMAAFTHVLPADRVAQGYGLFSLAALLPSALMPPFVETVTPLLPGPGWAYAMAAPFVIAAMLLSLPLAGRLRRLADALPDTHVRRPAWGEVLRGLGDKGVLALLASYLLMLSGHTMVYFFMKSWALELGAANPGLFFTVANLATISLRLGALRGLDMLNPGRGVGLGLLALGLLVPLFGLTAGTALLLCLGALYGLGLGCNMPLLNSAMYRVSRPHLRPANANLLLLAMDGGFILGPILGGWMLAAGAGLPGVFAASGALFFLGGLAALPVGRLTPPLPRKPKS